jgi:hypothetical protein
MTGHIGLTIAGGTGTHATIRALWWASGVQEVRP